jgi:hypothetical protein
MGFNPSYPCTIGLEWPATRESAFRLDADGKTLGMKLVASTNDNVAELWVALSGSGGSSSVLCEVYDITAGDPTFPDITTDIYRAGEDARNVDAYGFGAFDTGGTAVNIWRAVDDSVLVPTTFTPGGGFPVDSDFIYPLFGGAYEYAARVTGISGALTGETIVRVQTFASVNLYTELGAVAAATFRPYIEVDGVRYFADPLTISEGRAGGYVLISTWFVNPSTCLPWTAAELDDFEAGAATDSSIGFRVDATGNANAVAALQQVYMQVDHADGTQDPRLAAGVYFIPNQTFPGINHGWVDVPLVDPVSGAATNFNMVAGDEYLFTWRRVCGTGFADMRKLDSGDPVVGPPNWSELQVNTYPLTRRLAPIGEESTGAYAIGLQDIFTAFSVDSQPYRSLNGDFSAQLSIADAWTLVNASTGVWQQEFTTDDARTYDWLRILVKLEQASGADGDLVVTIRDVATDSQQGLPFTITADDLEAPRSEWQTVGVRMAGGGAALLAATQYYFDVTSTATAGTGWQVQVLSSVLGNVPAGLGNFAPNSIWVAGFGGVVDVFRWVTLGGTYPQVDGVLTLSDSPDAPTGFAAAVGEESCCLTAVTLSWDATAIADCSLTHLAYEIQRSDTVDTEWRSIAWITDEAVASFEDWEARRNITSSYRMRVWRSDLAPSDWTATVTAAVATSCCGLWFVSNEAPDLGVFYMDIVGDRVFKFPRDRQVFRPHGRNYQLVFSELEDRGVEHETRLKIRAGVNPCTVSDCDDLTLAGVDVFNPVKAIARAGLSYVCVLNEVGNRWFASVDIPQGEWRPVGGIYRAPVTVIQVTDNPSQPDASAAS